MSAYHRRALADEFAERGGTLTSTQIAAFAGFGWRRDLADMLRHGYPLVESPTDLWHLDLERLPESEAPDVGRAGDGALLSGARSEGGSPDAVASSPDADTHPQVEGEAPALFEAPVKAGSPYDAEAA